jgi:Xaa-Pro aminopeptidase
MTDRLVTDPVTGPGSADHAARRLRARDLLREQAPDADWLLVTSLANIRYLTGFSGSNAVFALHASEPDRDLLGTDGRYAEQVASQSPGLQTVIERATLNAIVSRLNGGPGTVFMESTVTLDAWQLACREFGSQPPVLDGLVEALRIIKDAAELAVLERACRITAEAFDRLMDQIRPGLTEVYLARRLEQLFGELGAQDRAFPSIVAGGPNSAIPHHECGQRPLQPGDLLVIDAGALVDGYHADMTRTVVVGRAPEPWQREIHQVVAQAQAQARACAHPGVPLASLDAAAREPIAQAGFADAFVHGLGHGVGLAIHEAPMIGARATGSILAGTPITIEPGIYLNGRGGVRIEDTVVVESNGARVLTQLPRDLVVVG